LVSSGKSIPQVAIRWLLQKDVVASVIIGANSIEQLEDNIGSATNWSLTKEQVPLSDRLMTAV
jgi:aryl-alcohol dehydrogenase-like predicted oxidoreductase